MQLDEQKQENLTLKQTIDQMRFEIDDNLTKGDKYDLESPPKALNSFIQSSDLDDIGRLDVLGDTASKDPDQSVAHGSSAMSTPSISADNTTGECSVTDISNDGGLLHHNTGTDATQSVSTSSSVLPHAPQVANTTAPSGRAPVMTNSEASVLFRGLIDEIRQHPPRPLRSAIGEALPKRDPLAYARAGVTSGKKFKQYTALAEAAGVITPGTTEEGQVLEWISLSPAWEMETPPDASATSDTLREDSAELDSPSQDHLDHPSSSPSESSLVDDTTSTSAKSHSTSLPLHFQALVDGLQPYGGSRVTRSSVATILAAHGSPSIFLQAGITGNKTKMFKKYIALAEAAGIITTGQGENPHDATQWISLNSEWQLPDDTHASTSVPSVTLDPGQLVPNLTNPAADIINPAGQMPPIVSGYAFFQVLIEEIQRQNHPCPKCTTIAVALETRDSSIYSRLGVANFEEYIDRAIREGIISRGETIYVNGKTTQWISLNSAWQRPQHFRTPTPPPTTHSPYIHVPPSNDEVEDNLVASASTCGAHVVGECPGSAVPKPASLGAPPSELPPAFRSLIEVLRGEQNNQLACSSFKLDPRTYELAGVTSRGQYYRLAVEQGIVTLNEEEVDGIRQRCISLNPVWRLPSDTPIDPLETTRGRQVCEFDVMVRLLEKTRENGVPRPFRSAVDKDLLAQNQSVYSEVGARDFSEYADLAKNAGIVELGGEGWRQWIALR